MGSRIYSNVDIYSQQLLNDQTRFETKNTLYFLAQSSYRLFEPGFGNISFQRLFWILMFRSKFLSVLKLYSKDIGRKFHIWANLVQVSESCCILSGPFLSRIRVILRSDWSICIHDPPNPVLWVVRLDIFIYAFTFYHPCLVSKLISILKEINFFKYLAPDRYKFAHICSQQLIRGQTRFQIKNSSYILAKSP